MKTALTFFFAALVTSSIVAIAPVLHTDHFKINTSESKITWVGEKVTGKHEGALNIKEGTISNNHGQLTGRMVMDMTSIVVTDLEGKMKEKLESHLHSKDFFNVAEHPESVFVITQIKPVAGGTANNENFTVSGFMTIKGIKQPLSFPVNMQFDGTRITAEGTARIDRTKYDIKYGSSSFVEDIGDKAIADEFTVKFSIVASK